MAYTPINWQTGDTITAEKMNKMDNGWGVSRSQLFTETVTTATASGEPAPVGTLSYSSFITLSSIVVTFEGTDYDVQLVEGFANMYGDAGQEGPDFSRYPFCIMSVEGNGNMLYTETAGTYAITVSTETVQTSDRFNEAVLASGILFQVVAGTTTWQEVYDAVSSGKIAFVIDTTSDNTAVCEYVTRVYISARGDYYVDTIYYSGSAITINNYSAADETTPLTK